MLVIFLLHLYLQASGDRNKLIHIWDPDGCELLHTFKGHRDAVSVSSIDLCVVVGQKASCLYGLIAIFVE